MALFVCKSNIFCHQWKFRAKQGPLRSEMALLQEVVPIQKLIILTMVVACLPSPSPWQQGPPDRCSVAELIHGVWAWAPELIFPGRRELHLLLVGTSSGSSREARKGCSGARRASLWWHPELRREALRLHGKREEQQQRLTQEDSSSVRRSSGTAGRRTVGGVVSLWTSLWERWNFCLSR